ncbi:MAG: HEAT repeat domain-containing protein, partial [Bacteroidota bacterium]
QKNKARIAALVDVADLSLRPYSEVRESLSIFLSTEDPMERYWALVAATHFGTEAQGLTEAVRRLADHDPSFLVRLRAVDFLARCAEEEVADRLAQLLEDAAEEDEPSASVLLNVVVSLQEAGFAPDYQPKLEVLPTAWVDAKRTNVAWRAKFLRGEL